MIFGVLYFLPSACYITVSSMLQSSDELAVITVSTFMIDDPQAQDTTYKSS
jgi:hypothetical protein